MTPELESWLKIIAAVIAILTFWKSLVEYIRQGSSKRAEQFLLMRSRLRQNPKFIEICGLLEIDSPELRNIPQIERDNFTGFFEELALLWNSEVFNDHVVYYMFSYFAVKCNRSKHFWEGMDRYQKTWDPFNDFVSRIEQLDQDFQTSRRTFSYRKFRV